MVNPLKFVVAYTAYAITPLIVTAAFVVIGCWLLDERRPTAVKVLKSHPCPCGESCLCGPNCQCNEAPEEK